MTVLLLPLETKKRQCKVLFEYLPQNEDELELKVGDIIDINEEVRKTCVRDEAAIGIDVLGIRKLICKKSIFHSNFFASFIAFYTNFKKQVLKWFFNDLM